MTTDPARSALENLVDSAAALHDRAYDLEQDIGWGRNLDRVPVQMACVTLRESLAAARAALALPETTPAPKTEGNTETAWERIQTRPVDRIVAEVFEEMSDRSDSDPRSPWADLALALCERIKRAESSAPAPEETPRPTHADATEDMFTSSLRDPVAARAIVDQLVRDAADGYEAGVKDALQGHAPADLAAKYAPAAPEETTPDEEQERGNSHLAAYDLIRGQAERMREAGDHVLRYHGHSNTDTECPACAEWHRALASRPAPSEPAPEMPTKAWSLKTLLGQCDNERERSFVRDAFDAGRLAGAPEVEGLPEERLAKLTDCYSPISHDEVLSLIAEVRAARALRKGA